MPDKQEPVKQAISLDLGQDVVAASHPVQVEFPRHVAPSFPDDKTFNTIKEMLIVVGCVSLPDKHFHFDSSFLLFPDSQKGFGKLADMRDALAESLQPDGSGEKEKPPLSIFGHADPVGRDDYNSVLSQRRVKAVYATLIRDVKTWEQLMDQGFGGDVWGKEITQKMQDAVNGPDNPPPAGQTRRELIKAYMDKICVRKDPKGQETPFTLDKTNDFLARGAGTERKGDMQGCGEFNPNLILSKKKLADFDAEPDKKKGKEDRDAANEINRRVIAFLFKPGSHIDPKKWPCPHVNQGDAVQACHARFWSDGDKRRAADAEVDKKFGFDQDNQGNAGSTDPGVRRTPTFACRFYHGIAGNSPCEGIVKQWVIRVLTQPPLPGKEDHPLANKRFVVTMGDTPSAPTIRGKTDAEGVIRLPVFDDKTTMELKIEVTQSLPKGVTPEQKQEKQNESQADEAKFSKFTLKAGDLVEMNTKDNITVDETVKLAAKQRLYNLGYGPGEFAEWNDDDLKEAVRVFQLNEKVGKGDGVLDKDTRQRLRDVHDTLPDDEEGKKAPAKADQPGAAKSRP
ncbi:MAG TPA: peptidoglycan-binding protein [Verrucomicrobiae bacterium]|nr:peptidoglycan-binding protein [Verrucomicrobiae bacterium]